MKEVQDMSEGYNNNRKDITPLVDGFEEGELNEGERMRKELIDEFKNDPLYPMVEKDFEIISEDIITLDPSKLYSTKDVVKILSQYDYLYDGEKGESYINENRIRWWLNEKDTDNLLFYFNLEKPGRSWVWNLRSIIKAKIVSILRFVKNHQQKMIKVYATGIQPNTPKISEENVVDLIQRGNFENINNFDVLKEITLAAIQNMSKEREVILNEFTALKDNYAELHGSLESIQEENEHLKNQLGRIEESSVTKEQMVEADKKNQEAIAEKDRRLTVRLEVTSSLKKEAAAEWDKENSGIFKKLRSKESEKEKFIDEYINKHFDGRFDKRLQEYESMLESREEK